MKNLSIQSTSPRQHLHDARDAEGTSILGACLSRLVKNSFAISVVKQQKVQRTELFLMSILLTRVAVPPEYFAHLDVNGRRLDLDQRPELLKGSIDFIVPKDYWVQDTPPPASSSSLTIPRQPQPLHYIFAIDVSADTSRARGGQGNQAPEMHAHPMLREVCKGVKDILYGATDDDDSEKDSNVQNGHDRRSKRGLPRGAKVSILTFDKVVYFYNLKVGHFIQV